MSVITSLVQLMYTSEAAVTHFMYTSLVWIAHMWVLFLSAGARGTKEKGSVRLPLEDEEEAGSDVNNRTPCIAMRKWTKHQIQPVMCYSAILMSWSL